MIDSDATTCLTISGAMAPIGLGGCISSLIENGFVDWIITTGANAYHDLHFAYNLPVRQGFFDVDDDILYSKNIVRIYDVYIKEIYLLFLLFTPTPSRNPIFPCLCVYEGGER